MGERVRWNHEAESAVLGAVLLDNDVLDEVDALVRAGDFYLPAHALVFDVMRDLRTRGRPLDYVTIAAELRTRQRLNAVGGMEFLGALAESISTTAHAAAHARVVAEDALARRVCRAAQEVVGWYREGEGTPRDFAERAAKAVADAAEARIEREAVPLVDALCESFSRMEDGGRSGVETGLAHLDRLTGGMHPGQLIVAAGRPGMGKSALALGVARHAARRGARVLYFSLEMPRVELANRYLTQQTGVSQTRLRAGRVTQDETRALVPAAKELSELPIEIDDGEALTLADIRARALRMQRKIGLGLVIVDYIQLMGVARQEHGRRHESREQEVSEISRGFKQLAKRLDVPVLALAQLNRGPEAQTRDKRPQCSHLRESGSLEQDADMVWLLYRDEVYNRDTADRGIAEVIVGKQRDGDTGIVRCR